MGMHMYNQSGRHLCKLGAWRANGGTTASNSDGSITSTVTQANTSRLVFL